MAFNDLYIAKVKAKYKHINNFEKFFGKSLKSS